MVLFAVKAFVQIQVRCFGKVCFGRVECVCYQNNLAQGFAFEQQSNQIGVDVDAVADNLA